MTDHGDELTEDTRAAAAEHSAGEAGHDEAGEEENSWRARLERLVDTEKLAETLRKERDEYLDLAKRAQADLANYRKRIARQQSEQVERAGEALLRRLFPLADALDAAAGQHPQSVQPLQRLLHSLLDAEGVERVAPEGELFDPSVAEAVEHHGEGDRQVVAEVTRPGYRWKGRMLRPASVKVRSEASSAPAGDNGGAGSDSEGERAGQG